MHFAFVGSFCVFSSCLFVDDVVSKSLGRTWHLANSHLFHPQAWHHSGWLNMTTSPPLMVPRLPHLQWPSPTQAPFHGHTLDLVTSGFFHLSNKDSHSCLTTACSQPPLSLVLLFPTYQFSDFFSVFIFRVPCPSPHSDPPVSPSSWPVPSCPPFAY